MFCTPGNFTHYVSLPVVMIRLRICADLVVDICFSQERKKKRQIKIIDICVVVGNEICFSNIHWFDRQRNSQYSGILNVLREILQYEDPVIEPLIS